ncbi:MAG: hypothetical protein WDW38_011023 [Sanguina aurantia]
MPARASTFPSLQEEDEETGEEDLSEAGQGSEALLPASLSNVKRSKRRSEREALMGGSTAPAAPAGDSPAAAGASNRARHATSNGSGASSRGSAPRTHGADLKLLKPEQAEAINARLPRHLRYVKTTEVPKKS